MHTFTNDRGELEAKGPTEINFTDRLESQLARLGFLTLCYVEGADYAVFLNVQSVKKPATVSSAAAMEDAAIRARFPFTFVTSRFMHWLLTILRDGAGRRGFSKPSDAEAYLCPTIRNYVCADPHASQAIKMMCPLRDARISLYANPTMPGGFRLAAWLQPWLPLEELNSAVMLQTDNTQNILTLAGDAEKPNEPTFVGNGNRGTHGCIHLRRGDAARVYDWVDTKTRITITRPW